MHLSFSVGTFSSLSVAEKLVAAAAAVSDGGCALVRARLGARFSTKLRARASKLGCEAPCPRPDNPSRKSGTPRGKFLKSCNFLNLEKSEGEQPFGVRRL